MRTPAGASSTESWRSESVAYGAVTGRAEWKAFGDWKNYNDFESWQGSDPLLVFGVAANYQQGDTGGSTQNPDNITWTADALWKFGGGNVFAAISIDTDVRSSYQFSRLREGGFLRYGTH